MARRKGALELVRPDADGAPSRRNRINFFELAYQRIEDLLVNCELKPGRFLTVQELQTVTGFGRTPVHNAVNQFAADTLIIIRPRHGLQIAPIDLARERLLLGLRRDIERFVVKLAAERASLSHRNQALHIERVLREKHDTLTLDEFNSLDRRIDALMLAAAGEPFLDPYAEAAAYDLSPHRLHPSPLHAGSGRSVRHDRSPSCDPQRRRQPARRSRRGGDRCADRFHGRHVRRNGIRHRSGLLDCSIEPLPSF